jgi:hypothetical protein
MLLVWCGCRGLLKVIFYPPSSLFEVLYGVCMDIVFQILEDWLNGMMENWKSFMFV